MSNNLDYDINKELGECYLFMGELDKAEDYYKKAAFSNEALAAPYLGLATIALNRGDLEGALNYYEKAYALEVNDRTLSGLGLIRMEQGDHESAFDLFQEALAYNPGNAVALNCLVREAYQLSRVAEALPYLESCLAVNGDENAHVSLAGCLLTLGRTEEARKHLERVLAVNPACRNALDLYEHIAA